MSMVLLNSGRLIDPFNLSEDFLTIPVLMKPLAKICRYTGQPDVFYSVAEHTVHLINTVPAALRRAAALHDLNEGITSDLPHPYKAAIPDFSAFEQMIQRQIFEWHQEPWENMELLESWDRRICADEMWQIFTPPFRLGLEPLGVQVFGWEWREAEEKLKASFTLLDLI